MNSLELARKVRLKALELCFKMKASHLGGAFSVADVLAVLYSDILEFDPNKQNNHIFAIISDGELDEGSTWESLLFASHHNLFNLTTIVDFNKIQSFGAVKDVLNLEPLQSKFESFGFKCLNIDGHDHNEIHSSLTTAKTDKTRPMVVLANTVKGKGVSFMENELLWHYKSPDEDQYLDAVKELESNL